MLPSKTIPTTGRGSGKRKRIQATTTKATVEEIEDEDSPRRLSTHSVHPSGSIIIEEIPSGVPPMHGASEKDSKKKVYAFT